MVQLKLIFFFRHLVTPLQDTQLCLRCLLLLLATAMVVMVTSAEAKPSGRRHSPELANQIDVGGGGDNAEPEAGLVFSLMGQVQELRSEVRKLKQRQQELMKREFGPSRILDTPVTRLGKAY